MAALIGVVIVSLLFAILTLADKWEWIDQILPEDAFDVLGDSDDV